MKDKSFLFPSCLQMRIFRTRVRRCEASAPFPRPLVRLSLEPVFCNFLKKTSFTFLYRASMLCSNPFLSIPESHRPCFHVPHIRDWFKYLFVYLFNVFVYVLISNLRKSRLVRIITASRLREMTCHNWYFIWGAHFTGGRKGLIKKRTVIQDDMNQRQLSLGSLQAEDSLLWVRNKRDDNCRQEDFWKELS